VSRTTTTTVPLKNSTDATAAKPSKKPVRKQISSKPASVNGEDKRKSQSKKASTKTGSAKPKLLAEKLLSPTSALLRLDRQDVLFGTSSQLALDEPAAVVRQLQQAMLESEASADLHRSLDAEHVSDWPRLQRREGKRSLWAASARDENGQMLDRQAVYMSEPDRTQDFLLLIDGANDVDRTHIDGLKPSKPAHPSVLVSSDLPTPPHSIPGQVTEKRRDVAINEALFLDIDDFPQEPPPSNQHVLSSFLDIDDFPRPAQIPSEPALSPFPPINSASTSLGLPEKKRGRPTKTQTTIPQRVTASAPIPKKPPAKSKLLSTAPPTTPKKKGWDRFANIEEILDSEDDTALSPTPPRLHKLQESLPLQFSTKASLLPSKNDVAPIYLIPEPHLQFTNIKSTLFSRITSLIRSLPPTTNPTKPSWHEKILMYDPIILEDFTAFLNTHPSIRSYRKATQKQIRSWKKSSKVKGEKIIDKEEDGMVFATEKEVETWMVRAWCEEMSVCCVFREGRGRGGARKCLY
jgi:hypothetical protein